MFDSLHYLTLIETKPNAPDQASPLKDWKLSETFQHLRHLALKAEPLCDGSTAEAALPRLQYQ